MGGGGGREVGLRKQEHEKFEFMIVSALPGAVQN